MMNWPLPQDFNEAVQNPSIAFADPDLKGGQPVVGPRGLPLPRSGNFADVYQIRGADGRDWAIKCFTRPVVGLDARYAKIDDALTRANLPFSIKFNFLAEGIRARGQWQPALKMEWVEGLLLNQVVRENKDRPAILAALGQMWSRLCKRLRDAGIAHADLQHGNVILVPGSRPGAFGLKLIDYDGMYVPALANSPSGESGHPNFQHPDRAAGRVYSPDLDRFPHLVIATALKGLECCGPALWDKYDTGDNLLFVEDDFRKPSGSELMRSLWDSGHPAVQALVGRLAVACVKPIPQTPWLDVVAPDGQPLPLDAARTREASAALGFAIAETVPVEATLAATPPDPSAVFAGLDLHDDPAPARARQPDAEKSRPARDKPARKTREAEKAAGQKLPVVPVAIALGVLLAAGAAVGAVFLFNKKKPDDAAQTAPPDERKPEPPREREKGRPVPPDDSARKPDREPDPDSSTEKKNPPQSPVAGPAEPGVRWTAQVGPFQTGAVLNFTPDGSVVAVAHYQNRGLSAFDARTGAPRALSTKLPRVVSANSLLPVDGPGIGGYNPAARALYGWRLDTNDALPAVPVPDLPAPPGDPSPEPWVWFAPNRKAVVVARPTLRRGMEFVPGPFRVFVAGANEGDWTPVVSDTWRFGWMHFTADSSRLLVSESTGRTRWFKLPSGEVEAEWVFGAKEPDNTGSNRSVGISADGGLILHHGRTDRRSGMFLLDGKTGAEKRFFGPNYQMVNASISADGRTVALCRSDEPPGGFTIDVIDTATGQVTASVPVPDGGGNPVAAARILPDGKAVAVYLPRDGKLTVYDVAGVGGGGLVAGGGGPAGGPENWPVAAPNLDPTSNPQMTLRWEAKTKRSVWTKVSADGEWVLARDAGSPTVQVYSSRTGALAGEFGNGTPLWEFIPLTDGNVASWAPGTAAAVVWNPATRREVRNLLVGNSPQLKGEIEFDVSPDQRYVVAGYRVSGGDRNPALVGQVRVFDTKAHRDVVTLDVRAPRYRFLADGRLLVADADRCRWFTLPDGAPAGEVAMPFGGKGQVAAISPNGSRLLFNPAGPSAIVEARTGKVLARLPFGVAPVYSAFSPDGRLVITVSFPPQTPTGDSSLDVIDLQTGRFAGRFSLDATGTLNVNTAAFTPDGKAVVLGRNRQIVQLIDMPGAVVAKAKNPGPGAKAGGPIDLKPKWVAPVNTRNVVATICIDPDAQAVFLGNTIGPSFAAIDLKTGQPRPGFAGLNRGVSTFFRLDRGRVGTYVMGDNEVFLWTGKTGQPIVGKHPVPDPPPGAGEAIRKLVALSPNGRYLVYARTAFFGGNFPEVPFRLMDTSTGKDILALDWKAGSVHFTADSSRVLLAEYAGRFRWFKLPTGEADGAWDFGEPRPGRYHQVTSMSADGRVVGYLGPGPNKAADAQGAYLLDGQTGANTRQFGKEYGYVFPVYLSADGRLAAVMRAPDPNGNDSVVDVVESATGAVVGRATVATTNRLIPTFELSPDGRALVVHDYGGGKLYLFELPAAGAAG
jgi:WD40 repeat protein